MKNDRGAITLFIIIGLVIILSFFLILFLNNLIIETEFGDSSEISQLQSEITQMKHFVESCIEETGKDAVYLTGLQGGYYDIPSPKRNFSDIKFPVYWKINEEKVPSKSVIENEMLDYIKDNLPACLGNFSYFKERGFDISTKNIGGNVVISEKDVEFNINYPLTISRNDSTATLEDFSAKANINYHEKYEIVNQIIEKQKEMPEYVPTGFIIELADEKDFIIETNSLDGNTILFTLIFDDKEAEEEIFLYSFINTYNWSQMGLKEEVSIDPIPEFTINESKIFTYQVNATGDDITFSAYTELFDIDPETGEISFDTSYIPFGERNILIKAEDEQGNKDFEIMQIMFDFEDQLPVIEPIGNLTGYVGEDFNYEVNATDPVGDFLLYYDDTDLFDMHPESGNISFVPSESGNYTIEITAVNSMGHRTEEMRLEIK